jgi:murein DD-endopeptidase MepM/ murein hydrolase activator NlpD
VLIILNSVANPADDSGVVKTDMDVLQFQRGRGRSYDFHHHPLEMAVANPTMPTSLSRKMSTARSVRAARATFAARAKRRANVARPVRRRLAGHFGLAVICFASLVPISATARADETNAEQAAREIQAAREQANAAAEAYFRAESDLEVLEDDLISLELESDRLQASVDLLRRDVESVAVARFVSSGVAGIPLLTGIQAPQDQVQAEVFVDVLTNTGSEILDRYAVAQKKLVVNEVELSEHERDIEAQKIVFSRLQSQAEDEVVRLRKIEEGRLDDEAVQRALASQLAEERADLEEQARREAEAAARAIPDPGAELPAPTTAIEPPPTTRGGASDGTDGADAGVGPNIDLTPVETTESTWAVRTNKGASGGTSGGRTGTGGTGSNPRPVDTGAGYIDAIVCPMPGSAYGDTWGAPRSGGRKHEGVDMIAPRGVPIYAVASGLATFKFNTLGGNAVSLVGDNGTRYYYGHLDSYEGFSRPVLQGEIIGYNGDTGNAQFSTPHLHFEIHPGGGLAVNPYASVRIAGC